VTGGAGFLGQLVIEELLQSSSLQLNGHIVTLDALVVLDRMIPPGCFSDPRVKAIEGDLGTMLQTQSPLFSDADAVIHLASAVSGECEADLNLGLEANLQTGIRLGQVLADSAIRPVLVFASSLAIYGGTAAVPLPAIITDHTRPTPQNSYGAQKLMLETLYADLDRRGLIEARTLRLMTVSVRPGKPNQAASGFLSGIVREPLQGQPSVVPVDPSLEVALNSPKGAVAGLVRALAVDSKTWGGPLGVNLPGIQISVQGIIDALAVVGGPEAVSRLSYVPDARISDIVSRWPSRFESLRAAQIGFQNESAFVDVVRRFQAGITL
jgi:D-erythronate 2-dehydrogenase